MPVPVVLVAPPVIPCDDVLHHPLHYKFSSIDSVTNMQLVREWPPIPKCTCSLSESGHQLNPSVYHHHLQYKFLRIGSVTKNTAGQRMATKQGHMQSVRIWPAIGDSRSSSMNLSNHHHQVAPAASYSPPMQPSIHGLRRCLHS